MCPNKEGLLDYQAFDGGSVLMGKNFSCKTIRSEFVRIKMFDSVIQTLTNVRHMLELRKN